MRNFFGLKRSTEDFNPPSGKTVDASNYESIPTRNTARARHSVAVSALGNRRPFHQSDLNRHNQSHLPPSRSHIQLSSNSHNPGHYTSKRSISASYVSKAPSQQQQFVRNGIYRRGPSLAPVASTPEKPQTRIGKMKTTISKKLNVSSILDWPADKWMEFLEYLELMDFDELGYTFGFSLNGFHLAVRVISAVESARRNLVNKRGNRSANQLVGDRLNQVRQLSKPKFSWGLVELMTVISFLLCVYSCYNAYKLFTARKSYQMHYREDMVNSPNATLVQSPTAPEEEQPRWWTSFLGLLRRTSSLLIGWPSPSMNQIPRPTQVHQLDMWNIDEVKLKIFTLYPPPQALLLHFASLSENCLNWTLMMAVTLFQTYWIVKFYSQLVKDKAIVQSEVMHEYNAKFVYPKAFPHTREASTMTSSAEFIRREDWMAY